CIRLPSCFRGPTPMADVYSLALHVALPISAGLYIEHSFTIIVANVNDAPTVTSTPITTATQGELYSYTLIAADEDAGDSTTLSAVTLPEWLNFDPATGVLSGTPTNDRKSTRLNFFHAKNASAVSCVQYCT